MKNKVVLYYPSYEGPPLGPPLSLLSIASPLLAKGFRVSIIDSAITPQPEEIIARELDEALCFGISLLTGPMIRSAVKVTQLVKSMRPDLPVIFGGWHPSLLPAQTLESSLADVVARGQGELTLLEIVEDLAEGRDFSGVKGCFVKSSDGIQANAERPVENIGNLPAPAFNLGDFDAYERRSGVRKVAYASSVGCPYACTYCTDMVFYKRRFNAYPVSRVISDVTDLVSRHRLSEVAFLDSNFPVDVKRAVAIARGFVESRVEFRWTFQASTDLLCRMSDEEVRLLGESGVSHMGFGTESASPEVLALMNKKHQRIDEMYETARKSDAAGIRVTFNLIFGYPGETEHDRLQTFRIMCDISRRHPNVSFSPNVFTPYPGLPIWPQLREMGVPEPCRMEDWADIALGTNHLPWLQGEEWRRLKRMLEYFLLSTQSRRPGERFPRIRRGVRALLKAPLQWRLRRNQYSFPLELWLARGVERLVTRRSLLTGEALQHGL